NGRIYVADTMNNQIDAFNSQGHFIQTLSGRLPQPCSITSTQFGDLWVSAGMYTVGRYRTLRLDKNGRIVPRGGPLLTSEAIAGNGESLYVLGRRKMEQTAALQIYSPPYTSGTSPQL